MSERVIVRSGPAHPDLPYRYGCSCGAVWNASAPIEAKRQALCGPFCKPALSFLDAPPSSSKAGPS